MKSLLAFVSAAVLATTASSAFAQSAEMIPPEMAPRAVGKDGMVCGKVEKARFAEGSEGQPTFLYMGGAFPRHTFSARIAGENRAGNPGRQDRVRDRQDPARRLARGNRSQLAVQPEAGQHQVIRCPSDRAGQRAGVAVATGPRARPRLP